MARVESVDDDDRWSKLPEKILEKIVSSLDVKSMVQVSSLTKSSRQLKKLWPPFYQIIGFNCSHYPSFGSDIMGKINGFATTLYVDHIVLGSQLYNIPEQMFSCKSLITLELKYGYVSANDLRFPTVRTLHIEHCSIN
ncbi:hypothetical protein Tsubulata_035715 [Turnera subulata]|uniref:F-box domain-containing protein n=1 Tax=Turnera subulata TaxID=218843 RepID=A0A9Q0FAZ4_9ROSI|nr:hypothetical protein Tsubulata_035715 [Turnera subulata]